MWGWDGLVRYCHTDEWYLLEGCCYLRYSREVSPHGKYHFAQACRSIVSKRTIFRAFKLANASLTLPVLVEITSVDSTVFVELLLFCGYSGATLELRDGLPRLLTHSLCVSPPPFML